jgi:D-alanyl-D-alanine carboxypeptidase
VGSARAHRHSTSKLKPGASHMPAPVLCIVAVVERLSLDDPAGRYLPGRVVDRVANAGGATVSQLLHHTSGTFDYLKSPDLAQEALGSYDYEYQGAAKLLEYAYDEDAAFAAGTSWGYSNTNFLLLELIAQRASGDTGKQLLESLVFEPLALRSTSYDPSRPAPRGMVRGYADLFADGELIDVTESELERFHYDGGVVSNVYDLADFLDALLASDLLQDEARAALLDTVPTHGHSERGTDHYGCGLILEQHPRFGRVYGHSGTGFGFSAHVYRIESLGITFAAIVNASQHTMEERSYRWFSPLKHDDILRLVPDEP